MKTDKQPSWLWRLVRLFHIHDWRYTAAKHFDTPSAEDLCLESAPATRTCAKCGKTQYRERHCLGLNPPDYADHWYDMRPKPECFGSKPGPQARAENDCGNCGHRCPCLANNRDEPTPVSGGQPKEKQ